MRKYILLPFVLFLLSIQNGAAGNFIKAYVDTNNWDVYDFDIHPLYKYANNTLPFSIDAIDFLDSLHGIATLSCYHPNSKPGYSSLIKTNDGGNSWYLAGKDTTLWVNPFPNNGGGITRLKYIDTNVIVAMSHDASKTSLNLTLKVSKDGGKTWWYKGMGSQDLMDSYGKNLIIAAGNTDVFISTDQGEAWKQIPQRTNDSLILYYIDIIKPNDIATIYLNWKTSQYFIYHSYDTLKTENYFGTTTTKKILTYFTFATPEIGWYSCCDTSKDIQSHYDYIYRTDDGGRTWAMQYKVHHMPDMSSFPECYLKIQAYDTLNVIAYGDVNKIVRTSDGGRTWKELVDYYDNSLACNSLAFVDQYHFYLTTDLSGKILKSKPMFLGIDKPEQYSSENSMLIYPNPVRDYFNIKDGSGKTIEVYSPEGRLLVNTLYSSPIDLSGFSAGIYFVKIDGRMYKIVKI